MNLNYRSFLREILIEKQKKNPKFSLRRFAAVLGVQPSLLSMILSGKRDLTEETSALISEKLNLNEEEAKRFHLLVRLEKASTPLHRERILKELSPTGENSSVTRDLAVDQFRVISEWYHLPLQILIDMDGFEWSEEAAAKALGISIHEVRQAIERMVSLEIIEMKNGTPRRSTGNLMVSSPFQNEALKKYHTQMLEKTIVALDDQKPNQRFTGTLNLAFTPKQMIEARKILSETMSKLGELAEKRSKTPKLVYHANLNLFSLMPNAGIQSGEQT